MYTVSVDEESTLTSQELSEDIEDALTSNPDSGLTVKPGSLSVEEGEIKKIISYRRYIQISEPAPFYPGIGLQLGIFRLSCEQNNCDLSGAYVLWSEIGEDKHA